MIKRLLLILLFAVCTFSGFSQDASSFVQLPEQIAIDSKDNIYVLSLGNISVFTPDGKRKILAERGFSHIAIDSKDNIYLSGGSTILKMLVDKKGEYQFEHYAGDTNYSGAGDGDLKTAKFNNIQSIFFDKNDDLYVADKASKFIKQVGEKTDSWVIEPGVPKKYRNVDYWYCVRKISNGKVSTLQNSENRYVLFLNVAGMTIDNKGNLLYSGGGMSRAIRKFDVGSSKFQNVAGKPFKREWCPVYVTGDTSKAELFDPGFLLLDKKGNIVFSDNRNHRITRVSNNVVELLAGNSKIDPCTQNIGGRAWEGHKDGKATTALFNFPKAMAYDSKGNLYIADNKNHCIRKLTPDGNVSSFTYFDRSKAYINNY